MLIGVNGRGEHARVPNQYGRQYGVNAAGCRHVQKCGAPTRLTSHPAGDTVRGFTPDGKGILFSSPRHVYSTRYSQLFTVPLTGGMPTQLPIPWGFEAAYSPGGDFIAYTPVRDATPQWKQVSPMNIPRRRHNMVILADGEVLAVGGTRLAVLVAALARHDEIVEQVVTFRGGRLIKTRGEGDATFSVFDRPSAAAAAAIELQEAIRHEPWALPEPMRIRVALHTGEVEFRDGDYFGRAVNRAARLRSLATGGQILCSGATAELVIDSLSDDVVLADLGMRQLKNLARVHRRGAVPKLPLEQCGARFQPQRRGIGRRRPVATEPDRRARGDEFSYRRQARPEDHVRGRAVRDPGPPPPDARDLIGVGTDEVRDPGPVAPPADVGEVVDGAHPEAVEADPKGELDDGKGEEVGRCQEPEVPRRQGELCDQRLGDQCVDGAVEIGEVVATHERQQDERRFRSARRPAPCPLV